MATDVTADEAWIVAGGDDGRAHLWHAHSGERLSPAYRAGGPVYGVRFSPDGTSFAMGGAGVYLQPLRPDARFTVQLADLAEIVKRPKATRGYATVCCVWAS